MAVDTVFPRSTPADGARPGSPREHAPTFGTGLALQRFAAESRSSIVRTAATGLSARAASRRDGLRRVRR